MSTAGGSGSLASLEGVAREYGGSIDERRFEEADPVPAHAAAGFPFALAGGGAFDSEYPHLPQERRSLCSARNVPGPHFGQERWVRERASPLTS